MVEPIELPDGTLIYPKKTEEPERTIGLIRKPGKIIEFKVKEKLTQEEFEEIKNEVKARYSRIPYPEEKREHVYYKLDAVPFSNGVKGLCMTLSEFLNEQISVQYDIHVINDIIKVVSLKQKIIPDEVRRKITSAITNCNKRYILKKDDVSFGLILYEYKETGKEIEGTWHTFEGLLSRIYEKHITDKQIANFESLTEPYEDAYEYSELEEMIPHLLMDDYRKNRRTSKLRRVGGRRPELVGSSND